MDWRLNTQQMEEEANQGWDSQIDDLLDDDETAEIAPKVAPHGRNGDSETARKRSGRKRLKRDITDQDLAVLEFLAKLKYANARQLGTATGKSEALVRQRLRALKSVGLVNSDSITGRRNVWFITAKGVEVLDMEQRVAADEVSVARLGDLSYSGVGHMLAVAQVAAHLVGPGRYPLNDKMLLPKMTLASMVTDYEIDRAWKSYRERFQQVNARPEAGSKAEKVWKQWLVTEAPTGMGMLFNKSFKHDQYGKGRLTHRPGLVLADARGNRIAVEVELTTKKPSEYEDIMKRYQENSEGFSGVVWITNHPLVKDRLSGYGEQKPQVFVIDLLGHDGEPFTESAWKL